eukprot:769361-Rhodomonas_salina.1
MLFRLKPKSSLFNLGRFFELVSRSQLLESVPGIRVHNVAREVTVLPWRVGVRPGWHWQCPPARCMVTGIGPVAPCRGPS